MSPPAGQRYHARPTEAPAPDESGSLSRGPTNMLDMSMQPVPRTLLRDGAYREIRDAIVAGTLAPGEILRDADLARRLGLSRAPVREALARLVAEGLVESKPQSYTRVTRIDVRDIRDAVVVVQ